MSVDEYKENLETLFRRLKESLPENCLVIWLTTLPISKRIRGGFLIPEIEFRNSTLRLDVLEANFFVHKVWSYCILVTPKCILRQTVKILMKCSHN